jgi:hypothetical protein
MDLQLGEHIFRYFALKTKQVNYVYAWQGGQFVAVDGGRNIMV